MTKPPVCLTIAGLDPSGGAGIIADIKTFSAFGCFATAVIASLTFQNTAGVFGAEHQSAESVRNQAEPVLRDFEIAAIKTGMLPTGEIIAETARLISENQLRNVVIDPVVRSTSGFDLIDDAALRVLIEKLFPLSDIVTPNIPEAERISGIRINNQTDIEKAACVMHSAGARNILIKGGHLPISDSNVASAAVSSESVGAESTRSKRRALDYLFMDGELHIFEGDYIETTATHGTGCTLASAIAANLALGRTLKESVEISKEFVAEAIRTAPNLGHGHSPINIGCFQKSI